MKTIILGIGNEIVKDDGVGIFVAAMLNKINKNSDIDIETTNSAGIYILDYIQGYDRAILIDSIKTNDGIPGEIYAINLWECNAEQKSNSLHSVDTISALTFYKNNNIKLPQEIVLYAIEAKDTSDFGEQLTPAVKKSAYSLYKKLKKDLILHTQKGEKYGIRKKKTENNNY